jgi:thiol:disulfide interchange protein
MDAGKHRSEHGKAAWWALLLLPLLAAGGWALGQMSGSDLPPPPPAASPEVRSAGDPRVKEIRVRAAEYRARVEAVKSTGRAPAAAPAEDWSRVMSNWSSLDQALDESRRNGKPVMIDFYAEWCGPCRDMKRLVFDDRTHGDAVRVAVIPVSIVDRVREEGRNTDAVDDLQRRYGVQAFPTLVVFHPGTGRSVSTRGFGGAQHTVQWIENAALSVR